MPWTQSRRRLSRYRAGADRRAASSTPTASCSPRCARSAATRGCASDGMMERCSTAELAGWDPTTSLAVLRVADLGLAPLRPLHRDTASGQPGARHRAVVEQLGHGERRHHLGHRRTVADGQTPRDRSGDSHDGPDARWLFWRRLHRRDRWPHWRDHRDDDSRNDGRDSGGDRVGRGPASARAWAGAARLSGCHGPSRSRCRSHRRLHADATRPCSSSASRLRAPRPSAGVLVGDIVLALRRHLDGVS